MINAEQANMANKATATNVRLFPPSLWFKAFPRRAHRLVEVAAALGGVRKIANNSSKVTSRTLIVFLPVLVKEKRLRLLAQNCVDNGKAAHSRLSIM
jgi:hypothetical protein